MRHLRILTIPAFLIMTTSCANLNCKPQSGSALQGTDTATVGLYLDKNGYPQASVETVTVAPGQRIVFVGPKQFDIFFKEQRSPIDKAELYTSNGILIVDIPKDVFDREDRKNPENKNKNEMFFRYGIRVDNKVTDPTIHIMPR